MNSITDFVSYSFFFFAGLHSALGMGMSYLASFTGYAYPVRTRNTMRTPVAFPWKISFNSVHILVLEYLSRSHFSL